MRTYIHTHSHTYMQSHKHTYIHIYLTNSGGYHPEIIQSITIGILCIFRFFLNWIFYIHVDINSSSLWVMKLWKIYFHFFIISHYEFWLLLYRFKLFSLMLFSLLWIMYYRLNCVLPKFTCCSPNVMLFRDRPLGNN